MQLFDDLEDFGAFDDAIAGDVRDPYADLAQKRREGPVQRLETSTMPHEESKPLFFVYRYDEVQQVLRDNETFSSGIILAFFGEALGKHCEGCDAAIRPDWKFCGACGQGTAGAS